MKIGYVFAVLAILLLVGCAQTTSVETAPPVETPVVEAPPVEEAPVEEPATASEVEILVRGYDPAELTVKKGTTVKFINTAPGVRILGGVLRSPRLESGDTFEYTFEEAGDFVIIGIISKARLPVTVTEE